MPRLTIAFVLLTLGPPPPAAHHGSVLPRETAAHPRVYELQVDIPGKAFAATLAIDPDAAPPTVTLQVGLHEAKVLSVKGTADSLDLMTSQDGDLFAYRLRLEGEKIHGTVLYNGGELKGTVTGQRQR